MTQAFDIIVAGAGMVGAALATGLGQSGFRVALVDRQSLPFIPSDGRPDIRVSALSAGSEKYLQSLGAWTGIESRQATPYRRLAVWDQTRHPLSSLLPNNAPTVTFTAAELGCRHLGHIVENRITQRALWETAREQPEVTIFSGKGVTDIHQTDAQVSVSLEDGSKLSGQLLVAADGAQSRIRDMAGIGVTRDQYGQQAMVISVRYRGAPEDITWQAFYPSGPRAFLPLHSAGEEYPGESWASLVWYDAPATLAELQSLSHEALAARIRQAFPDRLPAITHVDARAAFPIARQHARQYFRERVVLVGDAAHTINPLAGQGVNLGFQDAETLQTAIREARRQGRDLADQQWLQYYERQRRPANRRMMLAMDLFYHLFSNRTPPLHLARNLGLGAAKVLPFARNRVARYAMGIDDRLPAVIRELTARVPERLKLI
jgi:2-octaprenyl-3-methyl-6-methoxy-1,4-benzoquinol hydroxylase